MIAMENEDRYELQQKKEGKWKWGENLKSLG